MKWFHVLIGWLALGATSVQSQNFVNFEARQTSPVRLSPDGTRLFAVNTPDARLSVFDVSAPFNPVLIAEIPVGIEPVSVQPRNSDEVWVVNEVSDSISVVSVSRRIVTDTIQVKDEPADVVFANGRAFVTASRKNQIAVFDAVTHAAITNIPVFGENPRAIVANSNGTRIYAAFALSGNRTTLVPPDAAPAQTVGMTGITLRASLPAPPQVSRIVDATDPAWSTGGNAPIRYSMPDNDVVEIDTTTLAITRYFPRVGTVNLGLAVQPETGDLFVANTDARNLTRFEPLLRGKFVDNRVSRIRISDGTVTHRDLNPGFTYENFPNTSELGLALAQPTALSFGPSGGNFFIAAFGSDRVALMNADTGDILARIELSPTARGASVDPRNKRGPRGLALKPGQALYVHNRISNTLTVIDPRSRGVVREIPVGSHDPTPSAIRLGRGFLYDAKLSGAGTVSCASCHVDADMDLIAWDLGDPQGVMETVRARTSGIGTMADFPMHPMKGPMTTQTLRGLTGLDPLHWRGDRTNFLHFNGAFDGLMGGAVLSAVDMAAYRTFINTIAFQPNPNQNLNRTLPGRFAGADPVAGRNAYLNTNYQGVGALGLRCNTCHTLPTGTDRSLTPAVALQESQSFKVPQLRNIYQKLNFNNAPGAQSIGGFGLVHDGMDPSLFAFLSRPVFGTFANDSVVKSNLQAFVQCIDTGFAPAVGYARTFVGANVDAPDRAADWTLLEAQAMARTNIDLIGKGTIDGQLRGLLYDAVGNRYLTDKTGVGPFTRAQLRGKILAGDILTLMGVPPGAGTRMGLDRNRDGTLDGDAPAPGLRIARTSGGTVVQWNTNASGYVLEKSTALPAQATDWRTETSLRVISGADFSVTNGLGASNAFWRLRGL